MILNVITDGDEMMFCFTDVYLNSHLLSLYSFLFVFWSQYIFFLQGSNMCVWPLSPPACD